MIQKTIKLNGEGGIENISSFFITKTRKYRVPRYYTVDLSKSIYLAKEEFKEKCKN